MQHVVVKVTASYPTTALLINYRHYLAALVSQRKSWYNQEREGAAEKQEKALVLSKPLNNSTASAIYVSWFGYLLC